MSHSESVRRAPRVIAALALGIGVSCSALAAGLDTGASAPNFQLGASGGTNVSMNDYKGQVVLLNFWASWCGPCREEMPILNQLYQKYKPAGFTLLGVNVEPSSDQATKILASTPVAFPILFDKQSTVSTLYGVSSMPSTVIVDRKGVVRYVHHGYKPGDENEYMDQIRSLVRE